MDFVKNVKTWFVAARPKTLLLSAMPVCVASVMAAKNEAFSFFTFLITLFSAVLIQAGTNFANDYFDFIKGADVEGRCGPTRMMQSGCVSLYDILLAVFVTLGIATILGGYLVFLGGWPILLIGCASLICAIIYTGGPCPLAYNGMADLFVWVFFGPVALCGAYYLQTFEFALAPFLVGISAGAITTAVLVVNNLRDVDGDEKVHKKTLTVRLGKNFSRWEYILLMTLGALLPIFILACIERCYLLFIVAFYLFISGPLIYRVASKEEGRSLNRVLELTAASLCVFSVIFSTAWFCS